MAENQSYAEQSKARMKEITDSIETGIQELFQSDKYRQYLTTMSRFHKYSVNTESVGHAFRCGYCAAATPLDAGDCLHRYLGMTR